MTFKSNNKWDDSEELLFTCDCGSIEHQFHVSTVDNLVALSIILNYRLGIFRRIWAAIKYVLKYDKRGWMFEEILLTPADQRELASALSRHAASETDTAQASADAAAIDGLNFNVSRRVATQVRRLAEFPNIFDNT